MVSPRARIDLDFFLKRARLGVFFFLFFLTRY